MFKKILLATDFSQCAEQLWVCAGELRELGVSELVGIHITPLTGAGTFKKYAYKKLEEHREALETIGYEYKVLVRSGQAASEIRDAAEEVNAGLIVIGAKGENKFRRAFLGNTAWDLVRIGTTPILVEKYKLAEDEQTCQAICTRKLVKVLLPTDFSEESLKVVQKLKKTLSDQGASAVLVHVVDRGSTEEKVKKVQEEMFSRLTELKEELINAGIETEIRVRVGIASEHIITIARDDNVTLIAMAARGAGNIKELILGSTAENVVLKAGCSVLLFPA